MWTILFYLDWLILVKSILKIRSGFIGPDEGGLLRGVDWLKSDQGKEVNLIKLNRQNPLLL